jgi:hypothetical protein
MKHNTQTIPNIVVATGNVIRNSGDVPQAMSAVISAARTVAQQIDRRRSRNATTLRAHG